MNVIIDGIEYVPKGEIPPLTDERLKESLRHLVNIQYFTEDRHKHRAWGWDALNALAPELAKLPPKEAWNRIYEDMKNQNDTPKPADADADADAEKELDEMARSILHFRQFEQPE